MRTVSFAFASLAILASVATAQKSTTKVLPTMGPIKGEMTLELGGSVPKTTTNAIYSNTTNVWGWGLPTANEEWVDWGDTAGNIAGADHNTVIGGTFSYATTAPLYTGPSVIWRTYDGYTGGCNSLSPGGLAVLVTGLPGNLFTIWATRWTVGVNLQGIGCFELADGPFGYSYMFSDSQSGPAIASETVPGVPATRGSSNNSFDWVKASTGSCSPGYWFGGTIWAGWYTQFVGYNDSTDHGLGTGGITFSATGNSCPGGVMHVSVASLPPFAFSAVAIGAALVPSPPWDISLVPGVPPITIILGMFPGTVGFDVMIPPTVVPGAIFYGQWAQGLPVVTSNVISANVP